MEETTDKIQKDAQLLESFGLLPRRHAGQQVMIRFKNPHWISATARECRALRLEPGASIGGCATPEFCGKSFGLYACGELAERLASRPAGEPVQARATYRFGILREVHPAPEQPVLEEWTFTALVLTEILAGVPGDGAPVVEK